MKSTLLTAAFAIAIALLPALRASAVTDKEMDQARAIAAKNYLRYANNGSGYLDEKEYTSMAALEKDLKAKEKENLKAFKAVAVPKDYASWDKAKLVAYWSDTFFKSPGLLDEGRGGRSRTRKKIEAMSVSAPSAAKPETAPAEAAAAPAPATTAETPVPAADPADVASQAAADAGQQQDILADQKAIEDDKAAAASMEKEQSYTWVYILILALLVAVVIWLVAFAAKVMRKQESREADSPATADASTGVSGEALLQRDQEIARLSQRLRDEQERCLDTSRRHERLKVDNQRLAEQVETLRAENSALRSRVDSLTERLAATPAPQDPAPRRQERSVSQSVPRKAAEPEVADSAPDSGDILHVIYLGRANSRGIFVRADRKVVAGHTVFRLDTEDGLVGTFHVVDLPEVARTALRDPRQILAGGCAAKDFDDAIGASRVVTQSAGTAIFENGYWKVLRKAHIRFE